MTKEIVTLKRQLNEQNRQTERIACCVHSQDNFGPVTMRTKMIFPYENVISYIDAFQTPVAGHYFFFASIAAVIGSSPHVRIYRTDASGDLRVAGVVSESQTTIQGWY